MSVPPAAQAAGVSPYVPRGPVGHEIHGLRESVIILIVTSVLLAMFGAFFMVQAFNRADSAATTATKIQTIQKAQADDSANGRALLQQVAAIQTVIAAQTGPTNTARQQAAVVGYLQTLTDAEKTLNADLLHKMGQLAQCVPCSPAQVNRILAQPVPVITFGPNLPTASPVPARGGGAPPASPPTAVPSPTPSRSPAVNLQVQCPVICPPTK